MIPTGTDPFRPRTSDSRRGAFVEAARESFFSKGYGETSMSSIAARVGGSKTTLWAYFPSKQDLYAAVVDDLLKRHGAALEAPLDPNDDVADALRRVGYALLQTLHCAPIINLHRLALGQAARFPELAQVFYERGPARGRTRLQLYLRDAMARGKLRVGDPVDASRQFAGMLQTGSAQMHLFGLIEEPDQTELHREVEAAVSAFMRAWACPD